MKKALLYISQLVQEIAQYLVELLINEVHRGSNAQHQEHDAVALMTKPHKLQSCPQSVFKYWVDGHAFCLLWIGL